MTSNTTEQELMDLVNSDKCKSIRINGKNYWIGKRTKEILKQKHSGGIFPLLALIPGILAGIGAAAPTIAGISAAVAGTAGAAAGIAKVVSNSREASNKVKESELLTEQIKNEQIKNKQSTVENKLPQSGTVQSGTVQSGTGIYLNPYQGSAIHKYLKPFLTNQKVIKKKKFKKGIEIIPSGKGIYLNPYNPNKS